ncbi:MAG: transposase, partial [Gemmatimonadota bacterium]
MAAHLSDAVLPPVPLRQWVLSLPKRLRPYLPHDPQLAGAILRVLLRALQTRLRRTSPGAAPDARPGAVSFLHSFGSSLNPHFHFHVVVLDGLFSEEPAGTVRFHEATHLTSDDAHHLQRLRQRRILRLFQRRGMLEPATVENMLTWQGSGYGYPVGPLEEGRLECSLPRRGVHGAGGAPLPGTHDVELAELLRERWTAGHFREEVEDSGVRFDYSIRPGVFSAPNALRLLARTGYPEAV